MKIPGGTLPGLSCIVVAIAVAACAPGQTGSPFAPSDATGSAASRTPAPTTVATVSDAANGITFVHPAAWVRWQPNAHDPINDGPLIYLSTDPLLATCATMPLQSPNPPDARGEACDWPLRSLAPEGVFVDWYTTRILGPSPTSGRRSRSTARPPGSGSNGRGRAAPSARTRRSRSSCRSASRSRGRTSPSSSACAGPTSQRARRRCARCWRRHAYRHSGADAVASRESRSTVAGWQPRTSATWGDRSGGSRPPRARAVSVPTGMLGWT